MFDGLRFVGLAFNGDYRDHEEGRKLIWPHLVVIFFSLCCLVFVAYVSFSRYKDLVSTLLPYPEYVALCFTAAIALYMLNASGYVGGWIIQGIRRPDVKPYATPGMIIFLITAIGVGIIDFQMNLDGAADLAHKGAGTVSPVDEAAIMDRYDQRIEELEAKQKRILDKYTWKGVTYFKPSKYRPQAEFDSDRNEYIQLKDQAAKLRNARANAIEDARAAYRTALSQRDQRETLTYSRLSVAVRYVYFLQFALCIVGAYIASVLTERLNLQAKPIPTAPKNTRPLVMNRRTKKPNTLTVPKTKDGNRSKGYEIECQQCGKHAVMASPKAKYCSDACRKKAYEQRTGHKITV